MPTLTLSLKRTKSEHEQACGVCGAAFVPFEDSGARVLTVKSGDQAPLMAMMCGGCHSKWTAGATVTVKAAPAAPAG